MTSPVISTTGLRTSSLIGNRVILNGVPSPWLNVKIGVHRGSVLSHVLFLIYVYSADDGLTCEVSKFSDGSKIGGKVTTIQDKEALESSLRRALVTHGRRRRRLPRAVTWPRARRQPHARCTACGLGRVLLRLPPAWTSSSFLPQSLC